MRFFKKAKRGFTLVELVVVIAVIAILAAVSVGAYFGITESANNSRLEQETKQMHTAIQAVALGNNSNAELTSSGLTVKSIKTFEEDVEKNFGGDITVCSDAAPVIGNKPTIVLKTDELNKSYTEKVYKTYEYYQPQIGGKKIITDVVTGDTKIESSSTKFDPNANVGEYVQIYLKNIYKNWDKEAYVYTYSSENNITTVDNNWPGDKAEVVSLIDDIYTAEINTGYQYIIFSNGIGKGNDGHQQITIPMPSIDVLKATPYYNGSEWTIAPEIKVDAPTKDLTVYFRSTLWDNISIYAYNFKGENNEDWPGTKMEVYDPNRIDGLVKYTFKEDYSRVIFNNGDKEANIASTAQTIEISLDTFSETNCFYDGEVWTTLPNDYPTEPTYRTVYLKEPGWWHSGDHVSYVYQYYVDTFGYKQSINNDNKQFGKEMKHELWDGNKWINYRSFTFETTRDEVDGFRFFKVNKNNPTYCEAVTVDISLKDLGDNDLVMINVLPTTNNISEPSILKTGVSFGDYETDKALPVEGIYLKGTINNWSESSEYMLTQNLEGDVQIDNIELAANDEIKIHNINSDTWYGYNSELNSNYVNTSNDGQNIKFKNHGIYTIKLTLSSNNPKIVIEQIQDLDEPHDCNFNSQTGDCSCGNHYHVYDPETHICCGTNCDYVDPNFVTPESGKLFHDNTIFFDNSLCFWPEVYIYYWGGDAGEVAWPGVPMYKVERSTYLYSFCFGDKRPENIIFNRGGDSGKTADLVYPNDDDAPRVHNGKRWVELNVASSINGLSNNDPSAVMVFDKFNCVFEITINFIADQKFKITHKGSWHDPYGYDDLETKEGFYLSDNNNYIGVEVEGTYKITLNLLTNKITIIKI